MMSKFIKLLLCGIIGAVALLGMWYFRDSFHLDGSLGSRVASMCFLSLLMLSWQLAVEVK